MEIDFRDEKVAEAHFIGYLESSFDRAHFGFAGKYLKEDDVYLYVEFIFKDAYLIDDNLYKYKYAVNYWVYPYNDHNEFYHLNKQFGINNSGELIPNGYINNLDEFANDELQLFIKEFNRKKSKG